MYLAYMDECGNTGLNADPDQPIHLLGCLLVKEDKVRPLEEAIAEITAKHFAEHSKHDRFEWHGTDLYGGKGFFRDTKPQQRIDAVTDLFAAVTEHGAAFGYSGVDKIASFAKDHPHRICFTLLVERLEPWLKSRNERCLLVADENNEVGQTLITDMEIFKTRSTTWGYKQVKVESIVDSVHYVKSFNNRIVQATDVMSFIICKAIRLKRDNMDRFKAREDKSVDWVEWIKLNYSRADLATRQLWEITQKLTHFSNRIFPQ